ncbi:hypothetical protein SAMN05421640_2768 [Ekhidna lutea]|uniref:GyrI-like small molecule binding domain-containing protein n=1 Tax=Ekhidna lutea TaxID=447679 RepID=A0A239KNG5_EKHLU|nr:GyrI-like domain-containing protein [Ekhidna lutea]SNT19218.1 hypothetical protein SAMN05421640_2768 [Ekhidna lutea]
MEATIEKLDLQKADSNYYKASATPEIRDLDPYYYLSVQGKGHPESEAVWKAVEQLSAVAFTIKFRCKAEDMDFKVPKMEALWWIDGGLDVQDKMPETPKEEWNWKFLIRMPDFVEGDHFYRAIEHIKRKNSDLLADDPVKFELINEGRCVQMLHIGSYDAEEPTILKMIGHLEEQGLKINGYHHEIYLSDPRKTPEDRLNTIIRYAVK